jgi:lipoprotein-releasing system ATP-binding protein
MPDPVPHLELSAVCKSYEATADSSGVVVLRDIYLAVAPKKAVAIVGPSGSGKSTLLNIMGALDRPTSGKVVVNGKDLSSLNDAALAMVRSQDVGMVFQLHHLLPQCTVLENVLVPTLAGGPEKRSEPPAARAKRLLDRVGLGHRLNHRPGQLSGGERQRAAVVRAHINEPKILLADEPTGALDRAAADNLADLLIELNREESVTLIISTHAESLARRMQIVIELADGSLRPGVEQ